MTPFKMTNSSINRALALIIATLFILICDSTLHAQRVGAQLSSREAYVGTPIILQITVENAESFDIPELPKVDGCDFSAAGAPRKSSRISIINGRVNKSQSATYQFLITPRREGKFSIPAIEIMLDGKSEKLEAFSFVATKSEVGDLLFVEVIGGKEQVYVGEPLELKLKIWLKPYRDREKRVELTEGQMWQLISEQSSWGSFRDRMQELAKSNRRMKGQEVLRDNGEGEQRSYYLYELDATVYPNRPGNIDASDVQIVVNYPTELGRRRDSIGDFFDNGPLNSSSLLRQMLDDDFGGSPFRRGLTVSESRPIAVEASVDATRVLPIPTEGRPADYRGAVGQYDIITRATPKHVNAGDPITLNMGIVGTGPMDLVQAPPLATLPVTEDFKVNNQPLAGFSQGETKVFSTTIRPRREGITEIPPIPFSFFDPDQEEFKTVYSDPISIRVDPAESLSLDSIVAAARDNSDESATGLTDDQPNLEIESGDSVLTPMSRPSMFPNWLVYVIAPPSVWLLLLVYVSRHRLSRWMPRVRSAYSTCERDLKRVQNRAQIPDVLAEYLFRRTSTHPSNHAAAIGTLRTAGLRVTANEVESLFSRCLREHPVSDAEHDLEEARNRATELLDTVEAAIREQSKLRLRKKKSKSKKPTRSPAASQSIQRASMLLISVTLTMASPTMGVTLPLDESFGATQQRSTIELDVDQMRAILAEANENYEQGRALADSDTAESQAAYELARTKYQLLIDSGLSNSKLFLNCGNAYLQNGDLGRAAANYQKAVQLTPTDPKAKRNLRFAEYKIRELHGEKTDEVTQLNFSFRSFVPWLRSFNQHITEFVGARQVFALLILSSLVFWGVLVARTLGYRIPIGKIAIVPALLLCVSVASVALTMTEPPEKEGGILVVDHLTLRAGDGENFESVLKLESALGTSVEVLVERNSWVKVKTAKGLVGWVPANQIETGVWIRPPVELASP